MARRMTGAIQIFRPGRDLSLGAGHRRHAVDGVGRRTAEHPARPEEEEDADDREEDHLPHAGAHVELAEGDDDAQQDAGQDRAHHAADAAEDDDQEHHEPGRPHGDVDAEDGGHEAAGEADQAQPDRDGGYEHLLGVHTQQRGDVGIESDGPHAPADPGAVEEEVQSEQDGDADEDHRHAVQPDDHAPDLPVALEDRRDAPGAGAEHVQHELSEKRDQHDRGDEHPEHALLSRPDPCASPADRG